MATIGSRRRCVPPWTLSGRWLRDRALEGRPRLTITLDDRYPGIIAAARQAIQATIPEVSVRHEQRAGCQALLATHSAWPFAFPQHGPGRKHKRLIALVPWQRQITYAHPKALIRGIFCEHCELLGIRWTQSSFKNISIAHRDSVAVLDSFVGPKR